MATSDSQQQSIYQVRFDWGAQGARSSAADADILVLVDVLGTGESSAALETPATIIAGDLRNRTAIAQWVLARQVEKGGRVVVAVVAAGAARNDGTVRFAVEDLLAAGAVIDALATLGIDYCSPEAAAACAAFTGLRSAVAHLLTASVGGVEAASTGSPPDLQALADIDSSHEVLALQE